MPAYIKLCMETWNFDFVVLNYDNLHKYTDLSEKVKRFTFPQIADCVRVHVLRDNGGTWLDADTIVLGELPNDIILGNNATRENTIGFLNAEPEMFKRWAMFQDEIIEQNKTPTHWAIMGNHFTDAYLRKHKEITIGDITNRWAETYMINGVDRMAKYNAFYFEWHNHLKDIRPTDMLMLHNSWTPRWYKELSEEQVLNTDCTLSNILNEIHNNGGRQLPQMGNTAPTN